MYRLAGVPATARRRAGAAAKNLPDCNAELASLSARSPALRDGWADELTADCLDDQCGACCPDLPKMNSSRRPR